MNHAALCQASGRFAEAEKLYRRAVRVRKDLLGNRHPDLATTLNNLATLYRLTGRRARAAALYRRALMIFEETLDRAHPNVIGCRGNQARLEAER